MPELGAGTIVDGRYKVLSRLGSGGMADVFLAEDQQLGRNVALKLLHRRFAEDSGFVERFRREAQAAAGLQHPNVVNVYDRGSYDGTYYIAMEYLRGRSLKELVREDAPLDPIRAIDITTQILEAARFAHRHGVIHRDLKPHNVIVDDAGHVTVTDFGIARAGASDMTETGSIMGTAQYLSPEQAQGRAVSSASDLYSVGVVLYEMLTGRVPFDAEAAVTIALKHVAESPTAPTLLNPTLPPALEHVVMWALQKNPANRMADADQFIAALQEARSAILAGEYGERTANMAALAAVGAGGAALAEGSHDAGAVVPAVVPVGEDGADGAGAAPVADAEEEDPEQQRKRRRRRRLIALLAVLLLAGGALAAYLLTRPAQKVVPVVTGEQLNIARTQLQNTGFAVAVINVSDAKPAGTVIAQKPFGGTNADEGSTVTVTVSQGPGKTTVPSVQGLPLGTAEQVIRHARLRVGRVLQQPSNNIPAGIAIRSDPPAGQTPPVGTAVTIFLSAGKGNVTVPDVVGEPQGAAEATLRASGFGVTTSKQTTGAVAAGDVFSEDPPGGSQVPAGTTVSLVIAQAPSPGPAPPPAPNTAKVPDVRGQSAGAANGILSAAGFNVNQQSRDVTNRSQDGVVLDQSPAPGTNAQKGSTVTIVVGHFTSPPHPPTTPTTTTP